MYPFTMVDTKQTKKLMSRLHADSLQIHKYNLNFIFSFIFMIVSYVWYLNKFYIVKLSKG